MILVAALSEMAGALGPMAGAARRYDGPMGKSDRALAFGALGLWAGLVAELPAASFWSMPAIAAAIAANIANRVRHGVAEAESRLR